jgi:hypothetical protein
MIILDFLYFCGSFLPSWIRIRIQQLKLMRIHADPDPDTDPDPKPCLQLRATILDQIAVLLSSCLRLKK